VDILGEGNASRLRDVCIIDESNVWAVGEIYLTDSTGQFMYPPYNAVRWDGNHWILERIMVNYGGNPSAVPSLYGIFAFSPTDIWVSSGVPIHGDGINWTIYHLFDMGVLLQTEGNVSHMWGTSSDDLYLAGLKGSIIHYNGTAWNKIASVTNLDIQDIWGVKNSETSEQTVLAVAANIYASNDKEILSLNGLNVKKISTRGINWPLDAIWFDPGRIYYAVGAGIYSKNNLDDTEIWDGPGLTLTTYTSHAVRGNHINDVFIVGAFGDVLHYNGKNWRSYRETTKLDQGSYYSVAVKGNLVFAVGHNYDRAVVLRGRRN